MTDTCEHKSCIKMVMKNFQLELCISCGQIIVCVDEHKVKGQLYQTDEVRELLFDKIAQWGLDSTLGKRKN